MTDAGLDTVASLSDARRTLRVQAVAHDRVEACPVSAADGRVLAESIAADRAVPRYDRAATDGYAVRARDTFGASDRSPVTLAHTESRVPEGGAVPVQTGNALPEGAEAVVMVEQTQRRGADVLVYDAVADGENVATTGEDVAVGQRLLAAGRRVRPSDLALLRSAGHETVSAAERPRVSVIPTGDELVPAGADPATGETVETNGLLVSTLVTQWGGVATRRDIVPDDEATLGRAIERDTDHDVVVTTGGSSVGERDLVADVVQARGDVLFHGVALTPGRSVGAGVVDDTVVLVLPGAPVSCLVTAVQFLRPLVAWLAGTNPPAHSTIEGRLTAKLRSEPGTHTFARVRLGETNSEQRAVEPVRTGGAGVMSSVTRSDGWVEIPPEREGFAAGTTVSIQQWEQPRPVAGRDD